MSFSSALQQSRTDSEFQKLVRCGHFGLDCRKMAYVGYPLFLWDDHTGLMYELITTQSHKYNLNLLNRYLRFILQPPGLFLQNPQESRRFSNPLFEPTTRSALIEQNIAG